MQAVYSLGFKEVARQVSVHCSHWGELLINIFHGFFAEVKKAINSIKKRKDKEIDVLNEEIDSQQDFLTHQVMNLWETFESKIVKNQA